jgi:hypothetical protein
MSQVTIRRPFGELDLCDQVGSRTEYGPRQPALRFDRWRIQFNPGIAACFSAVI